MRRVAYCVKTGRTAAVAQAQPQRARVYGRVRIVLVFSQNLHCRIRCGWACATAAVRRSMGEWSEPC